MFKKLVHLHTVPLMEGNKRAETLCAANVPIVACFGLIDRLRDLRLWPWVCPLLLGSKKWFGWLLLCNFWMYLESKAFLLATLELTTIKSVLNFEHLISDVITIIRHYPEFLFILFGFRSLPQ